MNRLAIFYHCRLSGGHPPIDTSFAASIMAEQMDALYKSDLLANANEFFVGINGDESDLDIARLFVPCPMVHFVLHGSGMATEIPTLAFLRRWLPDHSDWYVLYHHIKGVTHPGERSYETWRRRMERYVVWGWRNCISELNRGTESCGAHWLTPERFPLLVHQTPFWGGTFWWATAKFLLSLPPLPPARYENRYAAEKWIGTGPRRPIVHDYYPGWP